jgi:hypothetical protein
MTVLPDFGLPISRVRHHWPGGETSMSPALREARAAERDSSRRSGTRQMCEATPTSSSIAARKRVSATPLPSMPHRARPLPHNPHPAHFHLWRMSRRSRSDFHAVDRHQPVSWREHPTHIGGPVLHTTEQAQVSPAVSPVRTV